MVERVVLIATKLQPRGTSRYSLNLAKELAENRIKVCLITSGGSLVSSSLRYEFDLKEIPGIEHNLPFLFPARQLRSVIEGFKPQIIHLQSRHVLNTRRHLRKSPCKMVLTVNARAKSRRQYIRRHGRFDGIIATSQPVREDLVNVERIPKDLIKFIPNGIDIAAVSRPEARPLFRERKRMIGTIGPVEPNRGQDHFIRAIPAITEEFKDTFFVIAGEGVYVSKLRKLVSDLKLDQDVVFSSAFSSYSEIINALDIIVYTSLEDVSAFSLLAAMAMGRPVVAFGTPATCSIIEHERTGIIVQKADSQELAKAVLRLLHDEEYAREIARAAQESIRTYFNVSVLAKQTIQFYNEISGG